ncbi:MAG: nitroreductase [Panacagrimonas sp.]
MNRSDVLEKIAGQSDATRLFASLLAERHSCRGFLTRPVARSTIECILELSQLTASWCNSQPWQLIVTEGAATDRFREAYSAHVWGKTAAEYDFPQPIRYSGVYGSRRRETAWQLYDSVGVARGDKIGSLRQSAQNFRLFGAPHVAILSTEVDLGVYGAVDCGAYVSNFMLAAQSCGVASIAQASIAMYAPFVRQYFGLPEHRPVVCGISFGYADPAHPANGFRTPRADLDQVVRFASE